MWAPDLPRGIRNNNPGNIRLTKARWHGQKKIQSDISFIEFENATYGLRALMKVLLTYHRKYHLDTVQSIINRWAPPHENATDHYAGHVAMRLNVKRTDIVNVLSKEVLTGFAAAITIHENGWPPKSYPKNWYEDEIYKCAYRMAIS